MLIKTADLKNIAAGKVSLAFRRWKRPTVKPGGTLRTVVGVLAIDAVDRVTKARITNADARKAGYASRQELLKTLDAQRGAGELYRITLHLTGKDPRTQLRNKSRLSTAEVAELKATLQQFDESSRQGAWTERVLRAINRAPGKPAAELAQQLKLERLWLKRQVRKLKELGLTESLSPGYRLSPRGQAQLKRM